MLVLRMWLFAPGHLITLTCNVMSIKHWFLNLLCKITDPATYILLKFFMTYNESIITAKYTYLLKSFFSQKTGVVYGLSKNDASLAEPVIVSAHGALVQTLSFLLPEPLMNSQSLLCRCFHCFTNASGWSCTWTSISTYLTDPVYRLGKLSVSGSLAEFRSISGGKKRCLILHYIARAFTEVNNSAVNTLHCLWQHLTDFTVFVIQYGFYSYPSLRNVSV